MKTTTTKAIEIEHYFETETDGKEIRADLTLTVDKHGKLYKTEIDQIMDEDVKPSEVRKAFAAAWVANDQDICDVIQFEAECELDRLSER